MTDDLDRLMRVSQTEPGRFEWQVPDGWQQGRGAFGGLVIGALVRAIEQTSERSEAERGAEGKRSLRSITAELPGPTLPGLVPLTVETLRAGSGQSTMAARLVQDGEVKAHCVAILAKPRALDAPPVLTLAPPALPSWRDVALLPMGPSMLGPAFAQHFEFRNVGPLPFTGGPRAVTLGWARPAIPAQKIDAAIIAAMCDQWWPALFSVMPARRPMATVAFTMQVVSALDLLDPEIPFAYRATVLVQHEGWMVEQRELWTESGTLVALNQQTFAVVK